jgi:hypothetical protein
MRAYTYDVENVGMTRVEARQYATQIAHECSIFTEHNMSLLLERNMVEAQVYIPDRWYQQLWRDVISDD